MIKKIISHYFLLLLFYYGHCQSNHDNAQIRAFDISYILPDVQPDGSVSPLENHYEVLYYKDMVMYRVYYVFDSSLNGSLLSKSLRSYYLVSQKDSVYGYVFHPYDPHMLSQGRIFIDSIRSKIRYESAGYDSVLYLKPDSTYTDDDGSTLRIFTRHRDSRFPEEYTFYLYYKKGLDIVKERFAEKIDRFNDMKLYKMKMVAKGGYWELYKQTLPKRELLLEIKEIPVENSDQVLAYFKSYEQRISR